MLIKCKTMNDKFIYINAKKIVTIEEQMCNEGWLDVYVEGRRAPIYVEEDMNNLVKRMRMEDSLELCLE